MPDKFKTPGSHAAVNANAPGAQGIVVDEKVQAELIAMRQESLRRMAEKRRQRPSSWAISRIRDAFAFFREWESASRLPSQDLGKNPPIRKPTYGVG
jgi:hypothetical protein